MMPTEHFPSGWKERRRTGLAVNGSRPGART